MDTVFNRPLADKFTDVKKRREENRISFGYTLLLFVFLSSFSNKLINVIPCCTLICYLFESWICIIIHIEGIIIMSSMVEY